MLAAALVLSVIVASGLGPLRISFSEWWSIILGEFGLSAVTDFSQAQKNVLVHIRIPRVLLGASVGVALALAGGAIQGLFRNPLADPSIIGVSAGSTLFAALAIVFGGLFAINLNGFLGLSSISIIAFLGAVLSTLLIFRLSSFKNKVDVTTMLLAGIAFNALAMSFTGLLSYITTDSQLRTLMFWTMGSLGGAQWYSAIIMMGVATLSAIAIIPLGKHLNALALGESEAMFLGTPINKLKITVIIVASLAVGVSVAFCGIIGFVGLVVPHLIRTMGVSDYRRLLIISALTGAILLCWTDTLSRTLLEPSEIPVGIITSLIGAPVFMFLLTRHKFKTA